METGTVNNASVDATSNIEGYSAGRVEVQTDYG